MADPNLKETMSNVRTRIGGDDRSICVVMPAYNAQDTLKATMDEIPPGFVDEMVLVDDHSSDETAATAEKLGLKVVRHAVNKGYGGNQKTCYDTALASGADIVVMLHPDNQYNPAIIPNLVLPLLTGQADVVLASRFIMDPLLGGPVAGGMPRHKFILNKMLTWIENKLMGTYFSEFHTGYRAYTADALRRINYRLMDDDFVFDNEMIAAMVALRMKIVQVAVETRYFEEASSISLIPGARYAASCLQIGIRYFFHRKGLSKWDWLEEVCRPSADSPSQEASPSAS